MSNYPAYSELPELGGLGLRHSRGELPADLGTLAKIRSADIVEAAGLVTSGRTIPLNLPLDAFDPPLFGRAPLVHTVIAASRNEAEDVIDSFNPQASSQLDGLAHVRAREYGFYDGSTDLDDARSAIGIENIAKRGIAGRGVLLDLTVLEAEPFKGVGFTKRDLLEVAERQMVELRHGDILLLHTGWASAYLAQERHEKTPHWNGLEASEEIAKFLWDRGIAAVGADNPAVENAPGDPAIGSLHRRLLPALGMSLFELLDLEQLLQNVRASERSEFLFVSVPLHVNGAVSSPANAMAIV